MVPEESGVTEALPPMNGKTMGPLIQENFNVSNDAGRTFGMEAGPGGAYGNAKGGILNGNSP